jgi:hypothetical protein
MNLELSTEEIDEIINKDYKNEEKVLSATKDKAKSLVKSIFNKRIQ